MPRRPVPVHPEVVLLSNNVSDVLKLAITIEKGEATIMHKGELYDRTEETETGYSVFVRVK